MEHSLPSLTFKGSITEAIIEAKRQKKLFVVYISGEDAESSRLEESTWTDSNVAESLSKYCILLHIPGGSTDASNFSALYPQKSVPCITAIGYNGVQLWQNDGFISAEDLASSLEKTWLSLHIQETTATFLTAALASKNPGASTTTSNAASSSEQSSASTAVPLPPTDEHVKSEEAKAVVVSDVTEEKRGREHKVEGKDTELDGTTLSRSHDAKKLKSVVVEQSTSSAKVDKESVGPVVTDVEESRSVQSSSSPEDDCHAPEKTRDNHSGVSGGEQFVGTEVNEGEQDQEAEAVNDEQAYKSDGSARDITSSEVHLNIRLPTGLSLQEKFAVTSTMSTVKAYVDENKPSGFGTYDLAIPYPRKVFSDQDLRKSLSELGLFNRQALIVVPHQRGAGSYMRGATSSPDQTDSTNFGSSDGTVGGYFSYVRRILSYMNPLSYLGGGASSSTSEQESQNGIWQYNPNPALRNNMAGTERPYTRNTSNQSTSASGRDDGKKRQPTTSRFGSNIHTLNHDDDDDARFSDRNSFWNGNSTQYGGNDDGK